jgi:hypothetical protein
MVRKWMALASLVLLLSASSAYAMSRGTSGFSIGISNGTADLCARGGPAPTDYISAYASSETGIQGEYWLMMTDDYAFTVSGGFGFASEKDEPGDGATPGSPDKRYSQSSFNVRLGGDRVAKVGERAVIYFGPGIEFWSGKATFENLGLAIPPATEYQTEGVTRISVSTRIGGHMMLGSNWGLTCHFDRKFGYASAEENGAKATWWPSSMGASGGLLLLFGGE